MRENPIWTEGYRTEIDYAHSVYTEMTPSHLAFCLLLKGIRPPAALWSGTFRFAELGCGQGVTSNLVASLYPASHATGVDFMPAHMAAAQRLADAVGNQNTTFLDESFAEFAQRDGEPFDIIALHGVWSWVSAENRRVLQDILTRRLAPGGVVYISYNCLPGWAAQMPVQRLLQEGVRSTSGPLSDRISAALRLAHRVAGLDAGYFDHVPGAVAHLNGLDGKTDSYISHEYLNKDWAPFYHADVAADMAAARLSFAGSATVGDHLDGDLPADARALLDDAVDEVQRETFRDYLTYNRFRRDLYVRGAQRLTEPEQRHLLCTMRFGMAEPVASPRPGVESRIWAQFQELGPVQSLSDLLEDENDFAVVMPCLTRLVALGVLVPLWGHFDADGARRFNVAVLDRNRWSPELRQLASPLTGGVAMLDLLERLFLLAERRHQDAPAFAWTVLRERGKRLMRDGAYLEGDDANLAEMRHSYARYQAGRRVFLQAVGIG